MLRRSGGTEFQSWGAQRLKALLPIITNNKANRENSEMDGGRGSERVSMCGNMEEVKKIRRSEIMNGFKREEKVSDGEPMKRLLNGCDVMNIGAASDNMNS